MKYFILCILENAKDLMDESGLGDFLKYLLIFFMNVLAVIFVAIAGVFIIPIEDVCDYRRGDKNSTTARLMEVVKIIQDAMYLF